MNMENNLIKVGVFLLILVIALRARRQRMLPSFGVIPIVDNQRVAPEQIARMIQAAERQRFWEVLVMVFIGVAAVLLCPWLGPL
jgi:hypothetical protein